MTHLDQFGEGLVDEDEGDEEGEDLLSETGHETNQDASLEGHSEDNDQHQPETDPHPARQILDPVVSAELHKHTPHLYKTTHEHTPGGFQFAYKIFSFAATFSTKCE